LNITECVCELSGLSRRPEIP